MDEGPVEGSLPAGREFHMAAAGAAPEPAFGLEPLQHGGTESTAEMPPAFAPIEADTAERAAAFCQRRQVDPEIADKSRPGPGQGDFFVIDGHEATFNEGAEHLHGAPTRQVNVADPRIPECCIAWTRTLPEVAFGGGKPRQSFQRPRHLSIGQRIVAVPPLFARPEKPSLGELRQMAGGRGGADPCGQGQFTCGQRLTIHQRREHVGAGWITDEGGDTGDIRSLFHGPSLVALAPPGQPRSFRAGPKQRRREPR